MSILFAQIPAGETETPPPGGELLARLSLRFDGVASLEDGGHLRGALAFEFGAEGAPPAEPVFSVLEGHLSLMSGWMYGPRIRAGGTLDGSLRLRGGFPSHAFGYEAPDVLDASLSLFALLRGPGVLDPSGVPEDVIYLSDTLGYAAAPSALHTAVLRGMLELASEPRTRFTGTRTLTDTLALESRLALIFRETLAVSLALGAQVDDDYTAMAQMLDALLLGGAAAAPAEAHSLLAQALTFGAVLQGAPMNTLSDALTLAEQVSLFYEAKAALLDSMLLGVAQTGVATLACVISDQMLLQAGGLSELEAHSLLTDSLAFVLNFSIDDEMYVAWSMNAQSKAASKYTNFPFNSFMKVGGKYYGASDTGLYLLEGEDDAGTAIEAKLRLGMGDMGAALLKRRPNMYIGWSGNNDLLLKVVIANPSTGEREAHVYRLYNDSRGASREGRVKIGQGLKSAYFDFQIENVDGGEFAIDNIRFVPILAQRRLRGNAGGKP